MSDTRGRPPSTRPPLAAQERDLKAAGAERIFGEQVSSAAKRAKLAECLAFLRGGDVLTVTKPDRLARLLSGR
jgi:DNA invertase Pin-like site-specific DNA recombinase